MAQATMDLSPGHESTCRNYKAFHSMSNQVTCNNHICCSHMFPKYFVQLSQCIHYAGRQLASLLRSKPKHIAAVLWPLIYIMLPSKTHLSTQLVIKWTGWIGFCSHAEEKMEGLLVLEHCCCSVRDEIYSHCACQQKFE